MILKYFILRTKRIFIFYFLLCSSLSIYGQSKFTILGYGQKINNGDTLFLAYKYNDNFIVETTIANDKQFKFEGLVRQPIIKARIYRNENPHTANIITESVDVYLEQGLIKINSPDTLTGAILGGTALNDTLQLLQNNLVNLKEKLSKIKDPDLFTEEDLKDTALLNYNKKELEKLFYEGADIRLEFVDKYPNSRVSLDLLTDLSRINTYIFKVETVFEKLASNLKETSEGLIISERIKKKRQVMLRMKSIDFIMKDNNGRLINISSFKGKYVLLDFWASWCGPCREEHPNLIKAFKNYNNKGFTIVSISIDKNKSDWLKAIEQDKITWTQLSDLNGHKGEVYLKYGITSIPANFLIDPNGIVIAKDLKGDSLKNELTKIFEKND